jgi:hypothetical protein
MKPGRFLGMLAALSGIVTAAFAQQPGAQVMTWGNLDSLVSFLDTSGSKPSIREWR